MINESIVCRLIEIEKNYGPEHVLGPVSISLEKGTVTGLRGENGAGKSTLVSVMAGVTRPSSGTRQVSAKNICYVPQELALYPTLSGKDNLNFWAAVYGLHGKEKQNAVAGALELVGLTGKRNQKLETYSGGMKRRLNLAAALLVFPELFLLDEPTAGCDDLSREIIHHRVRDAADKGAAVAIVSHNEEELYAVCDRILTVRRGLIVGEEQIK